MLPRIVQFEGSLGKSTYRKLGFRPPKRGEFYLSGAIVTAYRAPNDLTTPYHVVEAISPAFKLVRA